MSEMQADSRNIVLIGMPGSGKSTVGVLLAKQTGLSFVDTDLLIQARTGRTLQEIVDGDGYLALREIEEQVLLELDVTGHVISTGGSAVYSEAGMAHLKAGGDVVFLKIPLALVRERIGDYGTRGIARRPDQSLEDLFAERQSLYLKHAEIVIEGQGLSQDEACLAVINSVRAHRQGRGSA